MLIKEIVIIHKSLIVRKGLSAVLETYGRPVTSVYAKYAERDIAVLNKSIILADVAFSGAMETLFRKSGVSRNIFGGIASGKNAARDKYKVIIDINDSWETLFSKLDILFPSASVYINRESLLTTRETEILKLVAKGFKSREIAARLFISRHTVITHRKNICGKLGIKTPSGLTLYALINKII
ncbi:MAG: LuxR C-terminal-related transcriptional regulator [Bacteroidetes bacterium]|nr:LuxR C-terminal-related transcriptional regulator [Bacteroidota bacterium]